MLSRILIIKFLLAIILCAQEVNIIDQLKLIEQGEIQEARKTASELLSQHPDDPSVLFLDAVLTEDGAIAKDKYRQVYENYPESNYADAAIYRLFSYSFSLGAYKTAESLKLQLLEKYPNSPYIKAVNRNLPDENLTEPIAKEEKQQLKQAIQTKPDNFKFTIQAGAFLNVSNAQSLNKRFKEKGYHSEVFPKTVGGSILNVVTVGKFRSNSEAKDFLDLLKKDYNLNGRIISLK